MSFLLTKGVLDAPVRAMIYGPEGIGKTTFLADWLEYRHGALIDTEQGSGRVDVLRYPVPSGWAELLAMVEDAATNPDIGALGIDTADAAERMCAAALIRKNGWSSLEDPGYGGGYKRVWEEFSKLFQALNKVHDAGKDVILTAHAAMRKFEQPDQMGSYDRWELKLQNSQKCSIAALCKEWVDLLLFANYETIVVTDTSGKSKKAAGGKRVVYTTHHPCWDAKNRFGLPDNMKLEFPAFVPYLFPETPDEEKQEKPAAAPRKTNKKKAAEPVPVPDPIEEPAPSIAPQEDSADPLPFGDEVRPDELVGLPKKLTDLMTRDSIHMMELCAWSAKEGYFAANTPITQYDPDYLSEYLPSVWTKRIIPEVQKMREDMPF